MRNRLKRFKWSVLLVLVHLLIVLYFSTLLGPDDQIPQQWNYRGEIGRYAEPGFGLWFLWGMNAFLVAVFILFPWFSPRYFKNRKRFDAIIPSLTLILNIFLILIHLYMLLWAINIGFIRGVNFIFVLIGLLFIFLGNILPKLPSNFFAGVRTPWTLSSDKNWYKTHRLSGYVFVVGGVLMALRGFIEMDGTIAVIHTFGLLGLLLLYPVLYSYIFFLKERKEKKGEKK